MDVPLIPDTWPLPTIHPYSQESIGAAIMAMSGPQYYGAMGTSASWPTTNLAFYIPFVICRTVIIRELAWFIATLNLGGNVDVGIYDKGGNRLVSVGGVALVGTNTWQTYDIADTQLNPGGYYMAMVCSSVSPKWPYAYFPGGSCMTVLAMLQQTNAYPLPNPMVGATYASNFIPIPVLSLRAGF
jgi:hypothetical protein